MSNSISSADLRFASVDALRAIKPIRRDDERADAVSSETGDGKGSRSNFLRQYVADETKALAQLSPVRAALSPSDEVAIFGDEQNHQASNLLIDGDQVSTVKAGEAVSEDGEQITVDIITPQTLQQQASAPQAQDNVVSLVTAQAQLAAAKAYARNNDITFSTVPSTLLAA